MLSLWANALHLRTPELGSIMTMKCLTNSTTELPCRYSHTSYYSIQSHTWTTTNTWSSFTYCIDIYSNHNPLSYSYSYQTCHPHRRTTKSPTTNDDCIEHTTLSSWTSTHLPPRTMCHCHPLPMPKSSRQRRQLCLWQWFRTQLEYLRWVFHYHFQWKWILYVGERLCYNHVYAPIFFGYTRTPSNLRSLSHASHIHMLMISHVYDFTCFSYSHVNDFTCLWFHMLSVITCYSIPHVYYYLLCTMYL